MWPLVAVGVAGVYLHRRVEQQRDSSVELFQEHVDWAAELLGVESAQVLRNDREPNARGRPDHIEANGVWLHRVLLRLRRIENCTEVGLLWLAGHELQHVVHRDEEWRTAGNMWAQEHVADQWGAIAVARAGYTRGFLRCALPAIGTGCSISHGCPDQRLARSQAAFDQEEWQLELGENYA